MRNFKPLAILCGCTARFVSDLVGNHEDRFYQNEAHIKFVLAKQFAYANDDALKDIYGTSSRENSFYGIS